MDLIIDPTNSPTRVTLAGRVDAVEAIRLREALTELIASGTVDLLVDLALVPFIDSAGLAALVRGRRDALAAGGNLRLVAPRSNDAMRIFRLTRFDQVFQMDHTGAE